MEIVFGGKPVHVEVIVEGGVIKVKGDGVFNVKAFDLADYGVPLDDITRILDQGRLIRGH